MIREGELQKPRKDIWQIIDSINTAAALTAGGLMLLVALFMSYEAFARHLFNRPTSWVMSISILVFMWFPFLTTGYGIQKSKHVSCDVFVSRMPARFSLPLKMATDLSSVIFILALGWYGYEAFLEAWVMDSMSEGLVRYPMWLLRLAIPVGMGISALQIASKVAYAIRECQADNQASLKSRFVILIPYCLTLAVGLFALSVHMPSGILLLALGLLFWGAPISFALGLVGMAGLFFFHEGIDGWNTLPIVAEHTATNFVLLAIPLFTLGGLILSKSGLGEEMYDLSSKWLGWLPGGLGVATCITGGVLAAMIGSSTAVTAIVTLVAMKPLLARGYDKKLVIGTVTGSSLGLIIPPSVGFIVYGFLTDTSVGELFMAGVVPGAMLVLLFSLYVIFNCKITGRYQATSYTWAERLASLKRSVLILFGPVFVLGSIYSGLATPTEAGAILVLYSLLCAFTYRKLDWQGFLTCLKDSAVLSTMILMIMIGALAMSHVITLLQIPSNLAEAIVNSGMPRLAIILVLVVFYLCLGMFLDGGSITVLTVPVLAPLLPALGIDTVAFGVILMMLIETALLTPPVGLNIFTVKGIVDEPLSLIIKSVLPFVLILIFSVALVFVFPEIALWLPEQMR